MRINRELIWNVVDELQSLQYPNEDLSVTTISTLIDNIIDMYESCIIEIVESMIFKNERDIREYGIAVTHFHLRRIENW